MSYFDDLSANDNLITQLGEGNAHLAWAMALYVEEPDIEALASEAITDGHNDKKLDFIYIDRDGKRIIFAQGYFSKKQNKDSAPANKASDLNTAAAWIISGDLNDVPESLKVNLTECREAISNGEIDAIELLYVHNLPESVNVTKELKTAAEHMQAALGGEAISVTARELGASKIEYLFTSQESHIDLKDKILIPAEIQFTEAGPKWEASVASVPGIWLHNLYSEHGERLFSANYRGFLGRSRRLKINTGIRQSAESKPEDFWVFNNGITLLTLGKNKSKAGIELTGISIINGAQTTGSIGSIDIKRHNLEGVKVLCRIIECSDSETIDEIVKYNNTQNQITTWDRYSNDSEQNRIFQEFEELGHTYIRKRGFRAAADHISIGIEEVAQPLLAFHGKYQDAIRGKNQIFERNPLYKLAFQDIKARHILFVYTLSRAVDEVRTSLKLKSTKGTIIALEEKHLSLLRVLRFKAFLIAVVAKTLETIIRIKVDPLTVAFQPDASKSANNSLVDLTAMWVPVVEQILAFVATQVEPTTVSERFGEDEFINSVSEQVSALLYSGKASDQHLNFTKLISAS